MSDFKQWARDLLWWLISDPVVFIPIGLAVMVAVFFVVVFVLIKIKDVSGRVAPKTKASVLAQSGAIPGVVWPEPVAGPSPSMIVEPSRPRSNVTKIVFMREGKTTTAKDLEDRGIDLTRFVSSVTIGDTQPIEVTRDGEAQRKESEGSEVEQIRDDLDFVRRARTGGSRRTRKPGQGRRRNPQRRDGGGHSTEQS